MTMLAVRQYYYTSYVHATTGRAGFQIKAMSPGLSPRDLELLAHLIDYRLPPALDASEIETHPVALRYYIAEDTCILLCSQSCGTDEHSRPGNFFAHALVLPLQSFASTAPILFWKSSFWRSSDPGERTQVASLPILPSFDVAPSLDITEVWRFLEGGQRRALLLPLLCAVVHSSGTYRRIIIRDTCEHVALWIAAVSYLLPPAYRPLLTFATYHHDPRQAPYLITGTTANPLFHPTEEDHQSYFILDGEAGTASDVAPSPYAALVAAAAHSDRYETLVPLFAYAKRFPTPAAIDEGLDRLALYAHIQNGVSELTAEEVDVIHCALNTFEQQTTFTGEECEELRRMARILCSTMQGVRLPTFRREYRRILTLLAAHRIPLDDALLASFFSVLSLADFSLAELALCQYYRSHPALSHDTRVLVESILAISSSKIDTEQAAHLQHVLAHLSEQEYAATLENCIPAFFRHAVSQESHLCLVQALLSSTQQPVRTAAFWRVYRDTLLTMIQQPALVRRAIDMIEFWFSAPARALADEYIVQQFFLALPSWSRAGSNFQDFNVLAAAHLWYPSIRHLFHHSSPRSPLAAFRFQLTNVWQKRIHLYKKQDQGKEGQKPGKEVHEADIAALFADGVSAEEQSRCSALYTTLSSARFWPWYWKHFTAVLASGDAGHSLALLSFWFERSYDVLGDVPYLPQEFFLGLGRTLADAQGEWFRETISKMNAIVYSAGDGTYRWYPLLARYSGE
jgi:hypothetical protein